VNFGVVQTDESCVPRTVERFRSQMNVRAGDEDPADDDKTV